MSFYNTGNPVPSIDPRDLDDNAKHIDELTNSTFPTFVDRLGTVRKTIAGIEADADAATLRGDLAEPDGAELVGFSQGTQGSVGTTVQNVIRETISVKRQGAIGDGSYHPLSEFYPDLASAQTKYPFATSLTQSVDWAGIQSAALSGKTPFCPAGRYVLTDRLLLPDGIIPCGEGVGFWDGIFHNRPKTWEGTTFLMKGTGARNLSAYGVTGMRYSGGRRTDPDNPGQSFSLTSFMNADAVGATRATPRLFSAAIGPLVDNGSSHWGLRNIRVCPWMGVDGISGYSDTSNTSLGDDWDMGVAAIDSEYVTLDNVQIVGYWRMAAVAQLCFGVTKFGFGERVSISNSKLQGVNGILQRAGDTWSVLSKTTTTVTVRFSEEHYWPTSGAFEAPGNLRYTYSGLTFSGTDLTFTGVLPEVGTPSDPLTANISSIRNRLRGTGFAGCQITNTMVYGLDHVSGLPAASLGVTATSKPVEISGFPMRGTQSYNAKFQTHERVCGYIHNSADMMMFGGQFEGFSSFLIASPQNIVLAASDPLCPAADGDTSDLRMYATLLSSIDTRLFKPRSLSDDARQINPQSRDSSHFLLEALPQQDILLRMATGQNLFVSKSDGSGAVRVTDTGNVLIQGGGQLTLTGATAFINSDAAQDIRIRNGTTIRLQVVSASGAVAPGADGTQTLGTAGTKWLSVNAVNGIYSGPVKCGQYTLATLPSAVAFSTYEIDVTDATGGPKRCRSNGSVWQILNTTTTVS